MKNHTLLTLTTAALLAVTGCSVTPTASQTDNTASSAPTTVTKRPAFTPSPADPILPQQKMPHANAIDYWNSRGNMLDKPHTLTFPDEPDLANYPLTPEEQETVQRGDYLPATKNHPAFNVPLPEAPAELAESGRAEELATTFTRYWSEIFSYVEQTGDTSPLAETTYLPPQTSITRIASDYPNIYAKGFWLTDCQTRFTTAGQAQSSMNAGIVDIFIPVTAHSANTETCVVKADETEIPLGFNNFNYVMWVRYNPQTQQYQMIGDAEATGKYYDLPLEGKTMVCTFTPEACPQDTYDALREELAKQAEQEQQEDVEKEEA